MKPSETLQTAIASLLDSGDALKKQTRFKLHRETIFFLARQVSDLKAQIERIEERIEAERLALEANKVIAAAPKQEIPSPASSAEKTPS